MPAVPAIPATPPGEVTEEWLEIDGFSLSTPGWIADDLSELTDAADLRTSSRVIPGLSGVLSYRQRVTISTRSVPLVIFGDYDGNGDPHAEGRAGAEANIMTIRTALFTPSSRADGTRDAVLHLMAGDWSAQVKVTGSLSPRAISPGVFRAVLHLDLPYGPFAA